MWAFAETAELTDHRTVGLRPLASADSDRLFAFFQALPKKTAILAKSPSLEAAAPAPPTRHCKDQERLKRRSFKPR